MTLKYALPIVIIIVTVITLSIVCFMCVMFLFIFIWATLPDLNKYVCMYVMAVVFRHTCHLYPLTYLVF